MNVEPISVSEQIERPFLGRPHLIVIGAGGSIAATPNGDRNGRRLPLMGTLCEVLGIGPMLKEAGFPADVEDFEALYSDLHAAETHPHLLRQLEEAVHAYFRTLKLPDQPTIYDYLVLSLREKDLIATFNWDPLLFQACQRNYGRIPLPHLLCLHGNVAIGYCERDRVKGPVEATCTKCGCRFTPSRLLFPVKEKDYAADHLLAGDWKDFERALENAYILTIFGYRAPITDVKAIEVMKNAWQRPGRRSLEEVEIIDIRPPDELREAWDPFIVETHYRIYPDFSHSIAGKWPRRSCEAIWNQLMEIRLSEEYPPPRDSSLDDLQWWFEKLIPAEQRA